MRFYQIDISDTAGGKVTRTFSSLSDFKNDPGALNIEIDATVAGHADPIGESGAYLQIWGIDIRDISQAKDFNGKHIKVTAGMGEGLPLANPLQAGVIVEGIINQAFGNWIGTEQTLDFIIFTDSGTPEKPKNFVFSWPKGTPMAAAIYHALTVAFPDLNTNVTISPDLVMTDYQYGFYETLGQFAAYVMDQSKAIITADTYPGVTIVQHEKKITVYDGTNGEAGIDTITASADKPKNILFTDLIGQPTWIGQRQIQVTVVMRGDLSVSDFILLPPGPQTTLPQSYSQFRDATAFQGLFQINQIRHIGNFRQADATAWVTVIDAFQAEAAADSATQ